MLKHTIKTANVRLDLGYGTPPLDGIQLDRSTPIPDCSSGCKYVDWLRAVVTHFYTDVGDFEAVLTITDSSRGAVPFVVRKTTVKVSQRFETVSLMSSVGETDETLFQLPSFNPVLQKELRCNRLETRILYEEDTGSEDNSESAERWNEKHAFEGWNDSLAFKDGNEILEIKGRNDSIAFKGRNETLAFEGNNGSVAFKGQNEMLAFEVQNETNAFKGLNASPTFDDSSGSLPPDKWNDSLTFESAKNITFRAVIESDCAPSVAKYVISWSLRRLVNDGNYLHDDVSYKLVTNTTRFNIPSHLLSRGTYEVHLEVSWLFLSFFFLTKS